MRGKFITFEGPDGAGKSTQILLARDYLQSRGYNVTLTREPGGTPLAEKTRAMVLNDPMSGLTELLLIFGGRNDHVEQVIKPALERGDVVLSDRFADSGYAYQGCGRNMKSDFLALEKLVLKGFEPDYTLFFNIPMQTVLDRLATRSKSTALDKFETEKLEFFQRVYQGFQERLDDHPKRMCYFDATGTIEEVQMRVRRWVATKLVPEFPPLSKELANDM